MPARACEIFFVFLLAFLTRQCYTASSVETLTGRRKMLVQILGGGLQLESDNDKFFFTRDNQKTQEFKNKQESIDALRNHKVRWFKNADKIKCATV